MERIVSILEPLSWIEEPTEVILDLSGLAFIGPAALATLLTVVSDALDRGIVVGSSGYIPPKNWLVSRYLDRIDFNRLITGQRPPEIARHPPDGFQTIQSFSRQDDIAAVSESLAKAATEALAVSDADRMAVLLAITELAQNVIDHAESRVGGFAIAQRGRRRQEFEVAIADSGVGIASSLRHNSAYAMLRRDSVAIEAALKPGVTGRPGRGNHGAGLAAIRGFLRKNGGTMLVRSGCGAVEDGARVSVRDDHPSMRGTLVALRMNIYHPFDLRLLGHRPVASAGRSPQRVAPRATLADRG